MASPPFAAQRPLRAAPHRSFTLPPRLQDGPKEQALADRLPSPTIETLYEHPSAKIVCFNVPLPRSPSKLGDCGISTPEQSPAGVLPWTSDREWTVASGASAVLGASLALTIFRTAPLVPGARLRSLPQLGQDGASHSVKVPMLVRGWRGQICTACEKRQLLAYRVALRQHHS